jgi:hypothetical protein
MRWAGHVARMEEDSKHRILTRKYEVKRPFERPRERWMTFKWMIKK